MLELRARFEEESQPGMENEAGGRGRQVLVEIPDEGPCQGMRDPQAGEGPACGLWFRQYRQSQRADRRVYADHCLFTSNARLMADINRIFHFLEHPKTGAHFFEEL